MPRLVSRLPLLVLPLALYVALFHPATLDIGNAGWLLRGTDNGENALGLHAWLHDPAPGMLRTRLLGAPEGVPLLFTDSNPLLALLALPFAGLLPADAQFVGPWLLLCLFLQVGFAWALLRRHAPNPLALWCGVLLLAALPTLLNRYVHANLFAHWLILWALWQFIEPRRAASNLGWGVLIGITALVHSYLLVMVGAIWASAMIERFVADPARRPQLLAGAAGVLALVGGLAVMLGATEPHALAGNYGAFAMPLDALWNPGNPSYSRFLPSIEQRPGRGFEGFQYLGLGGLLLLVAAAFVALRTPPAPEERADLRRLRWLVPALAALTLLAVSNFPDIAGHKLPRLPLPHLLDPALDAVRASGRLFWPVSYVLVLTALYSVYRLPGARAGQLLLVLAALQLVDLSGMAGAIRATSAEAGTRRLYARTPDPRWDALIARARIVRFQPSDATRDLSLFQEIAWRAASFGTPVNTVYASRPSHAATARLAAEDTAFRAGKLDRTTLYVLLPGAAAPAGARVLSIDGVGVIAPR